MGLEPVLDHAAGTLIRLENLRINQFYAQQQPDHYNAEAVTAFRDEALAAVQALVDGKRLELVLTMAEEDTATMIDLFSAESYVRELVANCRSYAEEFQKDGHLASLEKLETAIAEAPNRPSPTLVRCQCSGLSATSSGRYSSAPAIIFARRPGPCCASGTSRTKFSPN